MICLATCLAILYLLLIILITSGWLMTSSGINSYRCMYSPHVSVIIPFRNEIHNLKRMMPLLQNQIYPGEKITIILADDYSSDGSYEYAQEVAEEYDNIKAISLRSINGGLRGKKAAVNYGALNASGELLLFTDADTIMGTNWIPAMVKPYSDPKIMMTGGMVILSSSGSFFSSMQVLEHLSLSLSSFGLAYWRLPFLISGANMAIRKSVYHSLTDPGIRNIVSGDDVFLLHQVKKKYGAGSVSFLKDKNALIEAKAVRNITGFIEQRKRWVSKVPVIRDPVTVAVASLVFGFNFFILLAFAGALSGIIPVLYPFTLSGIKAVIDFPLLLSGSNYIKQKKLMKIYIPLSFIYPVYVVVSAFSAIGGGFSWKGRMERRKFPGSDLNRSLF